MISPGSVDVKFSCFIQIRIIHRYAKYFRHKHRMTAKRMALHHPAGNIYRTFRNCRSFHMLHRNRCKSCFFKFIHISSADHAAVITGLCQFFVGQINHKFSGFLYDLIRITGWADGNGNHRWIGADGSCPCHGNNVWPMILIRHTDHHSRHRI